MVLDITNKHPTVFLASLSTWHARMGHANIRTVKKALARHSIPFSDNFSLCHACSISKAHKLPFHDSNFVATQPLELICSDLWGPAPVQSIDGASYYLLFFLSL